MLLGKGGAAGAFGWEPRGCTGLGFVRSGGIPLQYREGTFTAAAESSSPVTLERRVSGNPDREETGIGR